MVVKGKGFLCTCTLYICLCSSVIKEVKVNPVQCKAYGHRNRIESLKQKILIQKNVRNKMVSAGCGHNSGQVTHADTRMQRAVFSTLRPECIKYGYILTDNYISKMFLFFQIR